MIIGIILMWIILVICITIHEFAHAYMAEHLGDPTARLAGRLSLNPLVHIDMLGTVLLPLLTAISGSPLLIGWAKPTPFDPFNLRHPKKDSALIALAGPVSNLLIALFIAIIIRLPIFGVLGYWVIGLLALLIRLNILLAVFNLIPIHPLDGFKVVAGILPKEYYSSWMSLQRYGILLLLILLFPLFGTSPLTSIISPIVNLILNILLPGGLGRIT